MLESSFWDRVRKGTEKICCYICYDTYGGEKYTTAISTALADYGVTVFKPTQYQYQNILTDAVKGLLQRADALVWIGTPETTYPTRMELELRFFHEYHQGRGIIPIVFSGATYLDATPDIIKPIPWVKEDKYALDRGPKRDRLDEILGMLENFRKSPSPPVQTPENTKESSTTSAVDNEPFQVPQEEKHSFDEGKLILIGRGEVGKTSLVRRLVENKFDNDESKTQGINITKWDLNEPSTNYRLNIWDFGGQEIMHATHQFFLTERSIYILVLNGRAGGEDADVRYWLKYIESFGAGSPIIVVLNKIAEHPFELNYHELQAKYPRIWGFVKTDCKTRIGIQELRKEIIKAFEETHEIRWFFGEDQLRVKEQLETMKDEYIGYGKFTQICYQEGIKEEAEQEALRSALHCLGIALNYREDSRLKETSVLNPEWVTKGIYSVLNAKQLAEGHGELQVDSLQQILPGDSYPKDKHLFLLELMRKFSLCFAFSDKEERYLIPELLGKEEPGITEEFKPSFCLNFEYQYGILPEGFIPRFIVRSHVLSRNQARWRSGVILAHEDCKALVKAESEDRKVIIRVKGGNASARRNLLAIIRYDIDSINAEFNDCLDARPMVPLANFPEISIDYRELLIFEKQGVPSFLKAISITDDEQKIINVEVSELLNGIDFEKQRERIQNAPRQPKMLFLSYSHKDEGLKEELETHLKLLQRRGIITAWSDRKIFPGDEWDRKIDSRLKSAVIILLLVSADFMASDYCWDKEIQQAMERHRSHEATVIPIMLRPCDRKGSPFENLQGLPENMTPVTLYGNRDSAWTEIATGIRAVAEGQLIQESVLT